MPIVINKIAQFDDPALNKMCFRWGMVALFNANRRRPPFAGSILNSVNCYFLQLTNQRRPQTKRPIWLKKLVNNRNGRVILTEPIINLELG